MYENKDIRKTQYVAEEITLHRTGTQDVGKLQPQFQLSGGPNTAAISI